MTGPVFLILCVLSSMLVLCQGQIIPPTNGTKLTFLPGTTREIDWSVVSTSDVRVRTWSFKSTDGSRTGDLVGIVGGIQEPKNLSLIPRFEIEEPATLILQNVDETYDGMYAFRLLRRNVPDEEQSEVTVTIAARPTVTVTQSAVTADEGENVTLSGTSTGGRPPANVTWRKNGTEIGKTKVQNNTVVLRNVSEEDTGTYVCTAESYPDDKYRDVKSVELIVIPNSAPNNTTIEKPSHNAVLGERYVLTCLSDGQPEPRYTFIHNGTKITEERSEKGFLIFPVLWNTTGDYKCLARNKLGEKTSKPIFVKVVAKGIEPSSPTSTTILASSSTTKRDQNGTGKPPKKKMTLTPGVIAGIVIGALVFLVIVIVGLYCVKVRKRDRNKSNVNPRGAGNEPSHYELEEEEQAGQYDTVSATTSSKKPESVSQPVVYAAVNKDDREGKPLYATLDTVAMENNGSTKKRDEDRPPPTEYASIDFARGEQPPKADLV